MEIHHCKDCNTKIKKSYLNRHLNSQKHLKASGIMDFLKSAKDKITSIFDRRLEFNNTSRKSLEKYGNQKIKMVVLFKKPIHKMLDKVLNLISLGQWNKAKDEEDFDKLFHTGMIFYLDNGAKVLCEKVEEVKITDNIKDSVEGKDTQFMSVAVIKPTTMNDLFKSTIAKVGNEKFFGYSAMGNGNKPRNNCQDFIKMVCENLGSWTETAKRFIYQDIEKLAQKTPSYVKSFSDFTTNLGNVASKLMGNGMVIHAVKIKKDSMPLSEMKTHAEHIAKRKNMKTKMLKNHVAFRVIPRTKFIPSTYRTKRINDNISIVLGKLKN